MALTPAQLRQRDLQRRADARPPDPEPAGGVPTAWWRGSFETRDDLPMGGNVRGDVVLVMVDNEVSGALERWWDGTDWLPLAGGSGGVGPVADFIDVPFDPVGRFPNDTIIWHADDSEYVSGVLS